MIAPPHGLVHYRQGLPPDTLQHGFLPGRAQLHAHFELPAGM
jgi:hypothetical protein